MPIKFTARSKIVRGSSFTPVQRIHSDKWTWTWRPMFVSGLTPNSKKTITFFIIHGLRDWIPCGLIHGAAKPGSQIAVNKHFPTLIIHSYNATRHLRLRPEIPVLEKLCNNLELVVSRPISSIFWVQKLLWPPRWIEIRLQTRSDKYRWNVSWHETCPWRIGNRYVSEEPKSQFRTTGEMNRSS